MLLVIVFLYIRTWCKNERRYDVLKSYQRICINLTFFPITSIGEMQSRKVCWNNILKSFPWGSPCSTKLKKSLSISPRYVKVKFAYTASPGFLASHSPFSFAFLRAIHTYIYTYILYFMFVLVIQF